MATHFSILAWRVPWMEEPGGQQSLGWQKVGHDLATEHTNTGDLGSVPCLEDPLKKGTATHFSILAWRVPWTEESDMVQSTESQRVRHD